MKQRWAKLITKQETKMKLAHMAKIRRDPDNAQSQHRVPIFHERISDYRAFSKIDLIKARKLAGDATAKDKAIPAL